MRAPRAWTLSVLVIAPWQRWSPVEYSEGVRPRSLISWVGLSKRVRSPRSATMVTATGNWTPRRAWSASTIGRKRQSCTRSWSAVGPRRRFIGFMARVMSMLWTARRTSTVLGRVSLTTWEPSLAYSILTFSGILTAGRKVILPCHHLRGPLALGWLLGYYQLCYALRMPGAPSLRSGSGQTAARTVGEKHGNRRHPDVSRPKRNC